MRGGWICLDAWRLDKLTDLAEIQRVAAVKVLAEHRPGTPDRAPLERDAQRWRDVVAELRKVGER